MIAHPAVFLIVVALGLYPLMAIVGGLQEWMKR